MITGQETLGLSCFRCGKHFHTNCEGVVTELPLVKDSPSFSWFCNVCSGQKPVQQSKIIIDLTSESGDSVVIVSENKKEETNISDIKNCINTYSENKKEESNISDVKNSINTDSENTKDETSISDVKNSIYTDSQLCDKQMQETKNYLPELKNAINAIKKLKKESDELKKYSLEIAQDLNDFKQFSRQNNLEIVNFPEMDNENIYSIVLQIARAMRCNLAISDIDFCQRVAVSPRKFRGPKNIVVKLLHRYKKDEIIEAVRNRQRLYTNELGFHNVPPTLIYMREHLTPKNKQLYRLVSNYCKQNNYKYCLVKNCRIYIRKTKWDKFINIQRESDLP